MSALAALAATGAFAQSTVTLYGLADIGYTSGKKITSGTGTMLAKQDGITDGGFAGNRIGFRGTEDLGGGLKASFVIEQGISPTNGALFGVRTGNSGIAYDGQAASTGQFDPGTGGGYTQATNRQSYVGLESGMGTVRIGYQYTSLYELSTLSGFSLTSEGVYGAGISHTWGAGAVGGARANGITYISPRFNGFEVSAQIGSAGGRENTEWGSSNTANGLTQDKQKRNSVKLDYTQGPLRAAVAYTTFKAVTSARAAQATSLTSLNGGATPIVNTNNVYGALTSVGAATAAASDYSANLTQLGASYNLGVAKLGATYNSGSKTVNAQPTPSFGTAPSAAGTTANGKYDFKSMAVSANVPLGAVQLVASYGTAELTSGSTTLADYTQNQVGAVYALSKRTNAYVYTGSWKNSKATTASAAAKGSQAIFGVAHSF